MQIQHADMRLTLTGDIELLLTVKGDKVAIGELENASILVNFPKGTELVNKTTVDMKNAWLSFYFNKDRVPQWHIVCTEFEILDAPEVEGFSALDEDIPF